MYADNICFPYLIYRNKSCKILCELNNKKQNCAPFTEKMSYIVVPFCALSGNVAVS